MREHERDQYVQKSRKEGYRSRASYKLIALDEKDKLLRPGMTVVDLGAAPGGWSQVVAEKIGSGGRIVASDILPMDALADVTVVQGDFTEQLVLGEILAAIGDPKADLVISDMAPNMSGIKSVDQPASMYLVELALDLALRVLRPGGNFVAKIFQGEGFDAFLAEARKHFKTAVIRKPDASRPRSREIYLVAKGLR